MQKIGLLLDIQPAPKAGESAADGNGNRAGIIYIISLWRRIMRSGEEEDIHERPRKRPEAQNRTVLQKVPEE